MTPTRFAIARFAQAFGFHFKNRRMTDAAFEMHLLRDAETILGNLVWEKTEAIEQISVEYWNLRKLVKRKAELDKEIDERRSDLDKAHEERATILQDNPEDRQHLLNKRTELLRELEQLTRKRDQIIADAREVRRAFTGLQMKLEVVTHDQEDSGEARAIREKLAKLREEFDVLRDQRIQVGKEIEAGDAKVDEVDNQIQMQQTSKRELAHEAFQTISSGNKEIANLRSELSSIDNQMKQLYGEIGRYLSRNANLNEKCREAAGQYNGLIQVMTALRRSVSLNNRLAGLS